MDSPKEFIDFTTPRPSTDRRVFTRTDAAIFLLLTGTQLTAIGFLARPWFSNPGRETISLALLSIPLGATLLMYMLRWFSLPLMRRPRHTAPPVGLRVGVATTFVPNAEPIEMLEQTVAALVAMHYPHDTWVLDEADDQRVRALCARLGALHFSRRDRPEYQADDGAFKRACKHGNYNAWFTEHAFDRYDRIVTFDPDHVPRTEFLDRALGHFEDPRVGYVQVAASYYNQPASFIARGAAEESYAYFSSVQMSAYAMGYPIVTGSHTTYRTSALRDVGGLAAHDADDLLITILFRVAGWRGVYVPEALAHGLTPVDWPGYLTQQRRWTRSVLDVKLRVFPKVASRLPRTERAVSFVHGLYPVQVLSSVFVIGVLAYMLVTGRTPALVSEKTVIPGIAVWVSLLAGDLFRNRFFIDRSREGGMLLRARVLRIAKWPQIVAALFEAIGNRVNVYAVTRKVRSAKSEHPLRYPHLAAAALTSVSWAIGQYRGAIHHPILHVIATAIVVASIALAAMESGDFPAPYDPNLAKSRIAELHAKPIGG